MGAPHPESSNGSYYGPIRDNSLVRRYDLEKTDRVAQREILRFIYKPAHRESHHCGRRLVGRSAPFCPGMAQRSCAQRSPARIMERHDGPHPRL